MTSINEGRVSFLKKEIEKHDHLYWTKSDPEISDADYDKLVEELRTLDPENKLLSKVHSPVSSEEKVEHLEPMLSLRKFYTTEELLKWLEGVCRNDNERLFIQPKFDGCSAELNRGVLSTRGDGFIGENVTSKLSLIEIIPYKDIHNNLTINGYMKGEIVFTKDSFIKNKHKVLRKDGSQYKNERNAVGGILNRDDINPSVGKILTLVDFTLITIPTTLGEIRKLFNVWDDIVKKIKGLDYPTDGIVIKIADQEYARSLGETSHHLKSQACFKFENPTGDTVLRGITWSVGKNTITPIAQVDPVEISGITIQNVNLHNYKYIKDNDIKIGDTLIIERAGDVIPDVQTVIKGEVRTTISISECPSCGDPVSYYPPEVICVNINCSGMHLVKLMDSVVRIGIERLGRPTIKKMIETLHVKDLIDIFNLTKEQILKMEGFAESSTNNLFDEIQKVKSGGAYEWQILSSLNLFGIGTSLSRTLLENRTLEELSSLEPDDLSKIPGVGKERADVIYSGLKINEDYIHSLTEILPIKRERLKPLDVVTTKVCFTGKFPEKKSYYYEIIESHGYEVVKRMTKDLDILVVSDPSKGSNKQKKAEKDGIRIMSIKELMDSLK